MPLQAISHHLKGRTLQTVLLLCSSESFQQVHWFRQILARYPGFGDVSVKVLAKERSRPVVIDCPLKPPLESQAIEGWNFDSFDELSRAIEFLLTTYAKSAHISEEQIMIDFTGGLKVTSVVAAAATFNRKVKAQYVHTKSLKVQSYDVVVASPETGGIEI